MVKQAFVIRTYISIIIWLISCQLSAQTVNSDGIYRAGQGSVSFVSDAPLELISAKSNSLKGLLDPEKGTFAFQLATKTLTGFNSPLQQEHFYENYIETEKYPTASFSGKIIESIDFQQAGKHEVRAKGILDIHGVKKERIIKVALEIDKDRFRATSTFMVNIDDHNISIPKLVYQKIAEEVLVSIEVDLEKKMTDQE